MFRLILFMVSLFMFCVPFAIAEPQLVKFYPKAAVPQTGYTFGVAEIDDNGSIISSNGFRKGRDVYALLFDNVTDAPAFNTVFLGFTKNLTIFGGFELKDGMDAWVVLTGFDGAKPQLLDVIHKGSVDGYDYNFYFDLPSIDTPQNIADLDGDGVHEIELDFYPRKFRMLLEVRKSGMKIDYSSPNYIKSFNKVKDPAKLDEYQFREYLLYGILVGKLSEQNGLDKFLNRNKIQRVNSPVIIADAINLKELADSMNASDILVSYFSTQLEMAQVKEELETRGVDAAAFTFAVYNLEKELNNAKIDEVAFNDFLIFFAGEITAEEFSGSAKASLAATGGDIYSILTNYRKINTSIHDVPKMSYRQFSEIK